MKIVNQPQLANPQNHLTKVSDKSKNEDSRSELNYGLLFDVTILFLLK